jgi:hypothetical protein
MAMTRLRRAGAALVPRLPGLACDVAGYAGASAIAYGAWLVYPPAGFLVGGALLIVGAMLYGRKFAAGARK